jgi:hypothetical protein
LQGDRGDGATGADRRTQQDLERIHPDAVPESDPAHRQASEEPGGGLPASGLRPSGGETPVPRSGVRFDPLHEVGQWRPGPLGDPAGSLQQGGDSIRPVLERPARRVGRMTQGRQAAYRHRGRYPGPEICGETAELVETPPVFPQRLPGGALPRDDPYRQRGVHATHHRRDRSSGQSTETRATERAPERPPSDRTGLDEPGTGAQESGERSTTNSLAAGRVDAPGAEHSSPS